MGIKNIHVVLIVASIVLSIFYGIWAINHDYIILAVVAFIAACGLLVYCIKFIRKTKALV